MVKDIYKVTPYNHWNNSILNAICKYRAVTVGKRPSTTLRINNMNETTLIVHHIAINIEQIREINKMIINTSQTFSFKSTIND